MPNDAAAPLTGSPELESDAVLTRLLDALAPPWRAAVAVLARRGDIGTPEDLVLTVTSNDMVTIYVVTEDSEPLHVGRVRFDALPNRGAELRDAFNAAVAGILAGMTDPEAEQAVRLADQFRGTGGLVLEVFPAWSCADLLLTAGPGQESTTVRLGGIRTRELAN
jgi:hypothetical protein